MSVTLSDIRDNVLKDLGLDSANSTLQTRAARWINKTLDKLQGYAPEAEFMQKSEKKLSTVADQATYSLPSTFLQLLALRDDTSATAIKIVNREQFDRNHPDPSSESTGSPNEATLEYDLDGAVHIIRLAPIPDDEYDLYAIFRQFHPALSGSQDLEYDKLQTALEDGAIYHGSLIVYLDAEYANYRAELKAQWLESAQNIGQIFAIQKPQTRNIPVILQRYNW